MKRKIVISNPERLTIVAALVAYGLQNSAENINERFLEADPTNDGPEVAILSVDQKGGLNDFLL